LTAFFDAFMATYFPWLFILFFLIVIVKTFKPGLNKIYNQRVKAMNAGNGPPGAANSQLMKYDSVLDLLTSMEAGQVASMNSVGDQLKADHLEPMDDKGYQKMINDLHRIQKYKQKFLNNPIYMLGDTIGFPILKALIPDAEKAGKKLLRGVGSIGGIE